MTAGHSRTIALVLLVAGALLLLAGGVPAIGWVALAGVPAVIATTGILRRSVGVLLALLGLTAATTQGWEWLPVAGGACVLAGGGAVAVLGARWSGLGRRYERTTTGSATGTATPTELWQAMDRGQDLTEGADSPDPSDDGGDPGSR